MVKLLTVSLYGWLTLKIHISGHLAGNSRCQLISDNIFDMIKSRNVICDHHCAIYNTRISARMVMTNSSSNSINKHIIAPPLHPHPLKWHQYLAYMSVIPVNVVTISQQDEIRKVQRPGRRRGVCMATMQTTIWHTHFLVNIKGILNLSLVCRS